MLDKKRVKNGATLVEVLVAMLMLAVLVAALYVTFNECQNIISRADRRMIATYWAMDQMERLRQEVMRGDNADNELFGPVNPGGPDWIRWKDGLRNYTPNENYPANYNKLTQDYAGTMQWRLWSGPNRGLPGDPDYQVFVPGGAQRTGWRQVTVEVNWND